MPVVWQRAITWTALVRCPSATSSNPAVVADEEGGPELAAEADRTESAAVSDSETLSGWKHAPSRRRHSFGSLLAQSIASENQYGPIADMCEVYLFDYASDNGSQPPQAGPSKNKGKGHDPGKWGDPALRAEGPIDLAEQQALFDEATRKRRRGSREVQITQLESELSLLRTELHFMHEEAEQRIRELEAENETLKVEDQRSEGRRTTRKKARIVVPAESEDEFLNRLYKDAKQRCKEGAIGIDADKITSAASVSARATHLPRALQAGSQLPAGSYIRSVFHNEDDDGDSSSSSSSSTSASASSRDSYKKRHRSKHNSREGKGYKARRSSYRRRWQHSWSSLSDSDLISTSRLRSSTCERRRHSRGRSRNARLSCLKPVEPPKYSGDKADLREFYNWAMQCQSYLEDGKVHERDQVRRILPFLLGRALEFYRRVIQTSGPHNWLFKKFLISLFNYVFPTDFIERQCERYERMIQGNWTVRDYTYNHKEAALLLGDVTNRQFIRDWWRGLREEIQEQLLMMRLSPETVSRSKAIRRAEAIERALELQKKKSGGSGPRGKPGGSDHRKPGSGSGSMGSSRPSQNNNRHGKPNGSQPNGSSNQSEGASTSKNGPQRQNTFKSNKPVSKSTMPAKPSWHPNAVRDPTACRICGKAGHFARNCPQNNSVAGSGNGPPGVSTHSAIVVEDKIELAALEAVDWDSYPTTRVSAVHICSAQYVSWAMDDRHIYDNVPANLYEHTCFVEGIEDLIM
jgi:hypothetical protein